MAFLPKKTITNQQPQYPAQIDWGNPITRGLVFAGSARHDAVKGEPLAFIGTANLRATPSGLFVGGFNNNPENYAASRNTKVSSGSFTVFFVTQYGGETVVSNVAATFISSGGASSGGGWKVSIQGAVSQGLRKFSLTFGGVEDYSASSALLSPGKTYAIGVVVSGNGGAATYWIDGVADSTRAVATRLAASRPITIGSSHNGENYVDPLNTSHVGQALVWNRALTDAEIRSISANPWQVFL